MKYLDSFERKPSRLNTAEHGLFVPKQSGWPVLAVNEGSQQNTLPNGLARGLYEWKVFSSRAKASAHLKCCILNGLKR